jgi:hypothetical protein
MIPPWNSVTPLKKRENICCEIGNDISPSLRNMSFKRGY